MTNQKDPRYITNIDDVDESIAMKFYICKDCDKLKYYEDIFFGSNDRDKIFQQCKDCFEIESDKQYKEASKKRLYKLKDYLNYISDKGKIKDEDNDSDAKST